MANVCDYFCHDCWYRGKINGAETCCTYLLRTGKIRPCDPGYGCTVKVPITVIRHRKKTK